MSLLLLFRRAGSLTAATGLGTEADTASAAGRVKIRPVGLSPTVGAAWSDLTWFPLTEAASNDAFALARLKIRAAGSATETDAAFALGAPASLGRADETDAAYAAARVKAKPAASGSETDTASGLSSVKLRAVGSATVTGTAQALAGLKARAAASATGTDSAASLAGFKARSLARADESDAAYALASPGKISAPVGRADETDAAFALSVPGVVSAPVGRADETDAALELVRFIAAAPLQGGSVRRRKMRDRPAVSWVQSGDVPVIRAPKRRRVGAAAEHDSALALRPIKDYTDQAIVALLLAA